MAANDDGDFIFEDPTPKPPRQQNSDRIRLHAYGNPGKWFRLNRIYRANTTVHALRRTLGKKFEVTAQPAGKEQEGKPTTVVGAWHVFVRFVGTPEEAAERLRALVNGSNDDE